MNKIYTFRFLSILVLFSVLFPIGAQNLPILNRQTIPMGVWFIFAVLLEPKLFFNQTMYWLYACIILHCVGEMTFWNTFSNLSDWQKYLNVFTAYAWIALPITMNLHFVQTKDYIGYRVVTLIAILFIAITSITSIIGLNIYPEASRAMAAGAESSDFAMHSVYGRLGIASYGFYAALMFLIPTSRYITRNLNSKLRRIACYVIVLVLIYSIYLSQHTTIFLFAVIGLILTQINLSQHFKIKLIASAIVLAFSWGILALSLDMIANELPDSDVAFRLKDIAQTITEGDFNVETSDTYFVSSRLSKTEYSMDLFLANPILGSGLTSDHAYWIDQLALYGLIGFIPYMMILICSMRFNIHRLSTHTKIYYYIIITMVLLFGCIKNMMSVEVWLALLFILPGILYLYPEILIRDSKMQINSGIYNES